MKEMIQLKFLKELSLQRPKKRMFLGKDRKDAHSMNRKTQLMSRLKFKTSNQMAK